MELISQGGECRCPSGRFAWQDLACLFCCTSASALRSISFIAGLMSTLLASNSLHVGTPVLRAGMHASICCICAMAHSATD